MPSAPQFPVFPDSGPIPSLALLGRVAVVQPLPGIGDMVWHLPHLAAIARHAPGGRIILVGRPGSSAPDLLDGTGLIAEFLPVRGRRGVAADGAAPGALTVARTLAALGVRTTILLHHGRRLAMAMFAAGIAHRLGYGARGQRPFLNRGPRLTPDQLRETPFFQATRFIAACGWNDAAADPDPAEPNLPRTHHAIAAIDALMAGRGQPIAVLGLGSSEPFKQWGEANFAALCTALHRAGWPSLVVVGGPAEAGMLARLAHLPGVLPLSGLPLSWLAELLRRAALFIGNDTGTLNLAAATGCRCYGLFGGSSPISHSRRIRPILPPDGLPSRVDGMARITPSAVMRALLDEAPPILEPWALPLAAPLRPAPAPVSERSSPHWAG